MKTVIINQARMTSTRLPGKVLKEVMGKPLLEYQIERLKRTKEADEIVIATTINIEDEPIVELCKEHDIPFYRGSEEDVLSRYYEAAVLRGAEIIVRVTSDCPIIDPRVIDKVIKTYKENTDKYDYVSNTLERTYPRGMDTEVFSFRALEEAHLNAQMLQEREHVTLYIHKRPEKFRLGSVKYIRDASRFRWTVDTEEDFILISEIIKELYPSNPFFTLEDCLELVRRKPELTEINKHIRQKGE
ncbi:MAG: spore coat polysaccharide biosynthesis protein SpsF [Clostridiales bacterium]|nr:spore coat polysaccharide biosynthesis protein SpsF [Clostridiales bacterium]